MALGGTSLTPPGFVTFCRSNESNRANIGYLLPSILAYVAGLLLTFLALYFEVGGQGGQPALCYLVPTVLGGTVFYAHCRGELKEMWTGASSEETSAGIESEGERLIGTGSTNSTNVASSV
jgi:signal peptide peptidase-like protein 2B